MICESNERRSRGARCATNFYDPICNTLNIKNIHLVDLGALVPWWQEMIFVVDQKLIVIGF